MPTLYHLTAKRDFRLDPHKRPQSNTTLGGETEPGIFLSRDPEHWMNGYGYWQPWLVEFEVPEGLGRATNDPGEAFITAADFDKIHMQRVLPIDAFCRERFHDWGWSEADLLLTFDTSEPIPKGSWGLPEKFPHPGYRYPGDARQADPAWCRAYEQRIRKWRRTRNNAIASRQATVDTSTAPLAREFATRPLSDEFWAGEVDDLSRSYRDLPVLDQSAVGLWEELGAYVQSMATFLRQSYEVIVYDDLDPYETAEQMHADIDRGVYKVTSLHSNHPVWDKATNVAFRITHDITGHGLTRSDFSFKGEVAAYRNQCMSTPEHLWPVLFTEVVAQSAYANTHHLFGEQKVALLPLTQAEIDAHVGEVMDTPDAEYDATHRSASQSMWNRVAASIRAKQEVRRCDSCKGTLPNRTHRKRDAHGRLLCEECTKMKNPDWAIHSSLTASQQQEYTKRAAEALRSILRVAKGPCSTCGGVGGISTTAGEVVAWSTCPDCRGTRKVAHDSGDAALIHHCPFCGSGAVTGGSDGSADCDFCHTVFTVQVQPMHPNMPQTIDGQPTPPPGMPAGQETEMSAPVDPAVDEDASGQVEDPLGGAEADPTEQAGGHDPHADQDPSKKPNPFGGGGKPPAKKDDGGGGGNQPPWLKKKKSSARYFTEDGEVLDEDRYLRRLALDFADDRLAVLAKVREENN